MKKFRQYALIFSLLAISCSNTSKTNDEILSTFLSSYVKKVNKSLLPIILSKNFNTDYQRCLLSSADTLNTLGFTKHSIEDAKKTHIDFKTGAPILLKSDMPDLRRPGSWDAFKKKYPGGYYEISTPLINKSNDRIIISINYFCSERCGWGKTEMYEKTSEGWKLAKTLCEVLS